MSVSSRQKQTCNLANGGVKGKTPAQRRCNSSQSTSDKADGARSASTMLDMARSLLDKSPTSGWA